MRLSVLFALLTGIFISTNSAMHIPSGHLNHHQNATTTAVARFPSYTFDELYNLTVNFFDNFAYPNNAVQAKKINSTLFSSNVLGRVDVTRNFNGRELNTEYAFGLFSNLALNPDSFTLLGVPVAYYITKFSANEYLVSLALIVDFKITALGVTNPVEVDFWATFNHKGQIDQYDATFRYLQWQFDYLMEVGMKLTGIKSAAELQTLIHGKLADSICDTAQTFCNGTNEQYTSKQACTEHLIQNVPFGQAHEMGMNTMLCRMVHQNMVPYRPDVHCSHIGPTGGGFCTNDRTYVGTVTQPFFTNKPFIAFGKQNKNKTLAAE